LASSSVKFAKLNNRIWGKIFPVPLTRLIIKTNYIYLHQYNLKSSNYYLSNPGGINMPLYQVKLLYMMINLYSANRRLKVYQSQSEMLSKPAQSIVIVFTKPILYYLRTLMILIFSISSGLTFI
jgi:hypothetical protein